MLGNSQVSNSRDLITWKDKSEGDITKLSVKDQSGWLAAIADARFIVTVLAAVITLVLDAVTPIGFAIWLLQVGLVWIASFWASPRQIVAVAVVCSAFILLGFYFSPKTGLVIWVELSNLLLGMGATWAITNTSLRQRALEEARRKAEEIAGEAEVARRHQELKSMLLDALAHEFQTPLTSIRTGIAAMLAESTDPEQREWLEIMNQESARLNSMMVETIQMARIEAGHVELDMQTHTVEDLVLSAMEEEMLEPAQLVVEIPPDLPTISVDAGLIRLVIRQLVKNALKYSQPGTPIRLHAFTEGDKVIVTVTDRGPGIAPEEQARIFEKYYRGQHGRSHPTGMGMGLPIARQVIEAHGGRIWVESRIGDGATFSFVLPVSTEP